MTLEIAGQSHVGTVRKSNQDVIAWQAADDQQAAILVVADGMGGYQGGEIASRLAADAMMECLAPELEKAGRGGPGNGEGSIQERLQAAFTMANERVLERRALDPELARMGTTLVAAWLDGSQAHIAHVGDSRCYLLRQGRSICLTRDDTVAQNMVEDGSITESEVPNVPFRHVLTQVVGSAEQLKMSYRCEPVEKGDSLLLCSDGLNEAVAEAEWEVILPQHDSRERAVDALIERALSDGAPDNVSVVLLTLY